MNEWTPAVRRLGGGCALSVAVLDLAYVLTGVAWLASGGLRSPEPLQPAEPYLTILETLLFFSVPPLVVVAAAAHAYAPSTKRAGALASLAFMTAFAVVTCGVHATRLIVVRQLPASDSIDLDVLRLYPWPSVLLAVDLLAWDFFLGLALLLLAPTVSRGSGRLETVARRGLTLAGGLCLVGFVGPLTGEMRVQYLAIAGYAFVLPASCAVLARVFARATG